MAFLLIGILTLALPLQGQDRLTIGNGTNCTLVRPGTTAVNLPIYIQDVPGTRLGRDRSPGAKLEAYSFKVKAWPQYVVATNPDGTLKISAYSSGVTSGLPTITGGSRVTSDSFAYWIQFDERFGEIPFNQAAPFPGDLVGYLTVPLAVIWEEGTRVDLYVGSEPTATNVYDTHGIAREDWPTATLGLSNACIEVGYGDPGEVIPFGQYPDGHGIRPFSPAPLEPAATTLYGKQQVAVTTETLEALDHEGSARVEIDFKMPYFEHIPDRVNAIRPLQAQVASAMHGPDFQLIHAFDRLPAAVAVVNRRALDHLTSLPFVKSIFLDKQLHPALEQSTSLLNVPAVESALQFPPPGLYGDGVHIAVLDTGADAAHPDIAPSLDPNGNHCYFAGCNLNDAADAVGHGTGVIGVAAGVGDASRGLHAGFAPHAKVLNLRVMQGNYLPYISDAAAALQAIGANPQWNVRIVNMSFADSYWHGDACDVSWIGSAMLTAVNDLRAAGIALYAASGNNGFTDGMSFPACLSSIAAVGATYNGTYSNGTAPAYYPYSTEPMQYGTVAGFTNRSRRLHLIAPGAFLRIPTLTSLGGVATQQWGTSISSPTAAGIAALMLQRRPSLNAAEIAGIMQYNGGASVSRDELNFTNLDALACVQAVDPQYVRGDANGSGAVEVGDIFYLINALFSGGPMPAFLRANVNGDDVIDAGDIFRLLDAMFAGGPPIAP